MKLSIQYLHVSVITIKCLYLLYFQYTEKHAKIVYIVNYYIYKIFIL